MNLKMTLVVSMVTAGLLPMLVSSAIVDRQARDKLEHATYERLQTDVNSRKVHLEGFVSLIEQQSMSMANGPVVQDAMVKFSNAFKHVNTDIEMWGSPLPVEESVRTFYQKQFLPEYQTKSSTLLTADQLMPKSIQGQYLQHLYIAENSNPLGQKDQLLRSAQSSSYDLHHENFHPIFVSSLSVFDLYDVFLIEPEQGNVVYSVYKEVDYATSLFNGSQRDSGLAKLARKALDAPNGSVVTEDIAPYFASYNAPSSFIGAPIFDILLSLKEEDSYGAQANACVASA